MIKERVTAQRMTEYFTVQMKTPTVRQRVVLLPPPHLFLPHPTPSSLHDDRVPAVMYLCVFEGHPDRQGYHRHNLTAL